MAVLLTSGLSPSLASPLPGSLAGLWRPSSKLQPLAFRSVCVRGLWPMVATLITAARYQSWSLVHYYLTYVLH